MSAAIAKRLLWEGLDEPLARVAEKENRLFGYVTRKPDAREGVVAFFEKRPPVWSLSVNDDYPRWPE